MGAYWTEFGVHHFLQAATTIVSFISPHRIDNADDGVSLGGGCDQEARLRLTSGSLWGLKRADIHQCGTPERK
ncbi:hypothetical protein VTO73DRAFT_1795 [Trametes versicolor]